MCLFPDKHNKLGDGRGWWWLRFQSFLGTLRLDIVFQVADLMVPGKSATEIVMLSEALIQTPTNVKDNLSTLV